MTQSQSPIPMSGAMVRADDRSARREVRNPLLRLPAVQRLAELDPATRRIVSDILRDLAEDAAERAQTSWRQNKGPMAAYWKAVSVYAKHFRAIIRKGRAIPHPVNIDQIETRKETSHGSCQD